MHVSAEAWVIQTEFCFLVESMVLQLLYKHTEAIYSYQSTKMITSMINIIFSILKYYYTLHSKICFNAEVNSQSAGQDIVPHETQQLITVLRKTTQFTSSNHIILRAILILSTHLHSIFQSGSFLSMHN